MRYLLLFALLIGPFSVLSQANYHKATVTTTEGKVVSGYIDYREWGNNPKTINFRSGLDDPRPTIYDPLIIASFNVDSLEEYQSYKGSISMNKIHFPDIPSGPDSTVQNVVAFLKVVVKGENVTLLSFTDELKTRFFIREKSRQPYELMFQKYYASVASNVIRSDNRYISQLTSISNIYAPSNFHVIEKIQDVQYEENDIEAIVNMINGKGGQKGKTKRVTSTKSSNFRLYAGVALSTASSYFSGQPNFENATSTTHTPQINFGFDVFTNPSVQKFGFRLDVGLSYINPKINATNSFTTLASTQYTLNSIYTYDQYNLRITPQFIYNLYNANKLKLYIDAGFAINISKYSDQTYTVYSDLDPAYKMPPVTTYPPFELENNWYTSSFQTGIVINKRIEIFLNYIMPASYRTDLNSSALQTSYFNAGLHYLFAKRH